MAKRKNKTIDFDHWLKSTTRAVFVLDAERRIRAFNAGCESLSGWTAGDVVGATCHYGSVADVAGAAALAASLCPPPEVFAGEEASVPAHLVHRDGQALPRMLHFFPLFDTAGRQSGVFGVVGALSRPERAGEASLARQLHAELAALRMTLRSRFAANSIVAQSSAMRRVLAQVELALGTQAFVLFSGGAGSGKEHLARVIHFGGAERARSFIPLDCRRLEPNELDRVWNRILESHEPDAGANAPASPQPGTVFLADVEYLPRDLQERLVGVFSKPGPLRILAGTTLTLGEIIASDKLRADFYALISPLAIELPALSERLDDLPLLAQHFLEEVNRQGEKQVGGFDDAVWPFLTRYAWPGNLDELAIVVMEAHRHAADALIRIADLPYRFSTALAAQELPPPSEPPPLLLDPLLTKVETQLIGLALRRCRNNKSKAAELLGINRARLLRRIEQLQIGSENPSPPDAAADDDNVSPEGEEPGDAPENGTASIAAIDVS